MEMLALITNEETGNTQTHEEDDKSRVGVISTTAQNAEKMVMETPHDDSKTFPGNQIDLGVRVSGKKGIGRDDDQMMRKHRKEHFYTVRVDNLSFDATTSDVRQLFEQILPGESVADVYVPRDYRGGKCNRGFGFVRFLDPRASRSARKEMNGIEHFGRVLDVSFEQPRRTNERTFDRRRQQQQQLQQRPYLLRREPYSRGLENRLSRVQTYENIAGGTFQRRTQRSYRGGSSSYYDAGDDGYHNSRPSSSDYTKPKGELNSLGLPSASSNVRVHVSNLSWETTPDSLAEHCKRLSHPIVRCEVARMSNGKSKGWALMDFESLDQAEEGVKVLHDTELEGRHICVRIERKSVENSVKEGEQMDNPSSGVQVVVRNLPWTTTKDDLSAVFTEVGNVSAATVKCFSDSGRSKGWATVRFETKEEAETAIERFNGTDFGGREIEVRVDRFE
jgi:RNA recognition motif-containing protein